MSESPSPWERGWGEAPHQVNTNGPVHFQIFKLAKPQPITVKHSFETPTVPYIKGTFTFTHSRPTNPRRFDFSSLNVR
jgi:hypothetical protein